MRYTVTVLQFPQSLSPTLKTGLNIKFILTFGITSFPNCNTVTHGKKQKQQNILTFSRLQVTRMMPSGRCRNISDTFCV